MDEDKTKTIVTTPEESETQETVETPEAVDEQESTTQPTSEAAVEGETGKEQPDTTVSDWENEKKSMAGRISKYEKELNEYRQAKQYIDALNSAASNDPEFMKLANKKLVEQGVLPESVLEEIDKATPQQQNVASVQSNPALKWAQAKMQEEQTKREEFFIKFEEQHPQLAEGDDKIVKANRSAIGAVAAKRIAEGHSQEEAYELAYKAVMNPNQLVEEGKLQGMAQAQGALPVEGAASGGVAKSSGGVVLTPEQKNAARLFGLSEEEYAKNLEE